MSGEAPDITFAPVTPDDYPTLRHWLDTPPMNEWWGEPDQALSHIKDMVEGRDVTRPFIFLVDGEPAGYIQHWSVGDELDGPHSADAPWLLDLPRDAVGVDLSIGWPEFLGNGIGTLVLRAFLTRLFSGGIKTVTIDPDESNARAIRCYEKVGFSFHGRFAHASGVTHLMTITAKRFAETHS